jgi:hypothetical protein
LLTKQSNSVSTKTEQKQNKVAIQCRNKLRGLTLLKLVQRERERERSMWVGMKGEKKRNFGIWIIV